MTGPSRGSSLTGCLPATTMALFRLAHSLMLGRSTSVLLLGLAAVLLPGLVTSRLLLGLAAVLLLGLVVGPALLFCRGASLSALLFLHALLASPLIVVSRRLIGTSLDVLAIARSGVVPLPV